MRQDLLHPPYFLSFLIPLYSISLIRHFNLLFYPRSQHPWRQPSGEHLELISFDRAAPCSALVYNIAFPFHSFDKSFPFSSKHLPSVHSSVLIFFQDSNSALLIPHNFLNTMFNFHGFNHQLHRAHPRPMCTRV